MRTINNETALKINEIFNSYHHHIMHDDTILNLKKEGNEIKIRIILGGFYYECNENNFEGVWQNPQSNLLITDVTLKNIFNYKIDNDDFCYIESYISDLGLSKNEAIMYLSSNNKVTENGLRDCEEGYCNLKFEFKEMLWQVFCFVTIDEYNKAYQTLQHTKDKWDSIYIL